MVRRARSRCPARTAEVQAIVRLARQHHAPIVPQGGNTGLAGGATPDGSGKAILLSLKRLNHVRAIDPLNNSMVAEAGCILANLQQAASEADRLFPLSLSAEGTCQIGGNLATNAGGLNVLRFGSARDLCLGLEVVLPDGELVSNLSALRKDNTGYDLRHLFAGSEGTLGIITAAALKLFPKPVARATAMVALSALEIAPVLLARCRAGLADQLVSFELLPRFGIELAQKFSPGLAWPLESLADWSVLIEANTSTTAFDLRAAMEQCLGAALEAGEITDAAVASSEAQSLAMWRQREALLEGQIKIGAGIKHDVSVPVAQVPAFIKDGDRGSRGRLAAGAHAGVRPYRRRQHPFQPGAVRGRGQGTLHRPHRGRQHGGARRGATLRRLDQRRARHRPTAPQRAASPQAERASSTSCAASSG